MSDLNIDRRWNYNGGVGGVLPKESKVLDSSSDDTSIKEDVRQAFDTIVRQNLNKRELDKLRLVCGIYGIYPAGLDSNNITDVIHEADTQETTTEKTKLWKPKNEGGRKFG